jgi:hypothetical protein
VILRSWLVTTLATVTTAALAGCGDGRVDIHAASSSPGPATPPRTAVSPKAAPGVGPPRRTKAVSVGCASSVFSPGQTWPDHWPGPTGQSIVAGPVAWPEILELAGDSRTPGRPARASYHAVGGLVVAEKSLIAVNDGATVTISVPPDERRRLSLDYTYIRPRTAAGRYRVADGTSEVTFHACPPGSNDSPSSQFAGGFIVAGAQCARIDVQVGGDAARLERRIPFGVPLRTCRQTG